MGAGKVTKILKEVLSSSPRAIGEYLEAPFDWTLALDVEVHAGDDRWSHAPGLDSAKIVDPVVWLRNDPRVGAISVDALRADGSTDLADVFETAADFHAAMDDFDSPQRLVIEQSRTSDYGAVTQVYVTTAKPFPSAAVDAAALFQQTYPDGTVSVELTEGSSGLKARAWVPASVDVVDATRVVGETLAPVIPVDDLFVHVGPVVGLLPTFTEARIPFVRAIVSAPDVTAVVFSKLPTTIRVTGSAESWTSASDIALATLAEPVRTVWTAGDVSVATDLLGADDPFRTLLPALAVLPAVVAIDHAAGELAVTLDPEPTDAELAAFVATLRDSGLGGTISLELRSFDAQEKKTTWARIAGGEVSPEGASAEQAFPGLAERFAQAWDATA